MSGRASRRRGSTGDAGDAPGFTLRVGLRLDDILERASAGDALVIDVLDMDRPTARRIVQAGAGAVINVSPSYSGRFPVTGPTLLVEAGVELVDGVGTKASLLRDGERVQLRGGEIVLRGVVVAAGRHRTLADLGDDAASAGRSGGVRIRTEALVSDTVALLRSTSSAEPTHWPPELEALVRGRAVVLVAGALDPVQAKAIDNLPDRVIAAVGDDGVAAASARGLTPDVVVGGTAASSQADVNEASRGTSRRRRAPEPAPSRTIHVAPAAGWPPIDGAATLLLSAGARAVVMAGADGVDDPLMGLLDRPRVDAASTGLLRLDAGGRLVALPVLQALTETPRKPRAGRDVSWLGTPGRRTAAAAAAVVGALVIGLLLGAGPLAGAGPTGSDLDRQRAAVGTLSANKAELEQRLSAADAYLTSAQQKLVAGALSGRRAVIVSAEGIPASVIDGVDAVLVQAGATVAGRVGLTSVVVDPARQASLDDIAARLAPAGTEAVTGEVGSRVRAGLAASIATSTKASVGSAVAQGQGLIDALVQVGAIELSGAPADRSGLVVLLVPNEGSALQGQALASLGRALAGESAGAVMSTPGTPGTGSAVLVVQASVEGTKQPAVTAQAAIAIGRVSLVQALADAAS